MTGVFERTADHLLLGRRTYDIFAAHWPRVTDENDPIAVKLNCHAQVRRLAHPDAAWSGTTPICWRARPPRPSHSSRSSSTA